MARKRTDDSKIDAEVEALMDSAEPVEVVVDSFDTATVPTFVGAPTPPSEPTPEPTPHVESFPRDMEQSVPLRVFVTLAGKKQDQLAGFVHYATKQKLGSRSIIEWQEEMETFYQRPVR